MWQVVTVGLSSVVVPERAGRPMGSSSLPDEDLMLRYGRGDLAAFEELYHRHRAGLYRFIGRLCDGDADEIFQEVWLAVIKARKRYVPAARFVTYLFTIAHHRAVERLRRRGQWQSDGSELDGTVDDAPGPYERTLGGELSEVLKTAIASLPPPQREAFLMQAEGDLSLEEIAAATGAPRETVKSRLRYANHRLRTALESYR